MTRTFTNHAEPRITAASRFCFFYLTQAMVFYAFHIPCGVLGATACHGRDTFTVFLYPFNAYLNLLVFTPSSFDHLFLNLIFLAVSLLATLISRKIRPMTAATLGFVALSLFFTLSFSFLGTGSG